MPDIAPTIPEDQTHAMQGVGAAAEAEAEAYPILTKHWPNFTELLAAERRRQFLSNHFDQHVVRATGDDHWPEPQILVAGGAQ